MKIDSGNLPISVGRRFIGYTVLFLLVAGVVNQTAKLGNVDQFEDGGLTEWVQLSLTIGSLFMLLATCFLSSRPERNICCVLSGIMGMAVIRELDTVFDRFIPYGGWKLPMGLLVCMGGGFLWIHRNEFKPHIRLFVESPAFTLLWVGFCVVVYAQMTGHERYWMPLLKHLFVRAIKRINEETIEMLGYLFLFAGSVEHLAFVIHRRFMKFPQKAV